MLYRGSCWVSSMAYPNLFGTKGSFGGCWLYAKLAQDIYAASPGNKWNMKYMFVFTERHVAREYLQAPASWCDKTQSSL
jgi:hypothetical protein